MVNMNTKNLAAALQIIHESNPGKQVIMIEFEDGSGHKFNFQFKGEKRSFIDLTKEFKAAEIISKF